MTTTDDLDALLAHVGDARGWTWVLDYDGTLAPIVEHPDAAVPAPGAASALAALAAVCEVAVLSGRGLDDLVARFGDVPPRLLLVGGHGSEARLPDGSRTALTDLAAARDGLDDVAGRLAGVVDPVDGWLVERKATSIAVHHRRVPDDRLQPTLDRVRALLDDATSTPPGFAVLAGKAVLEIKVAATDKGRAVDWIVAAAADAEHVGAPASRRPLVLGDDVTDEDAFAAAVAAGGTAVFVGEGTVGTVAGFRLRDPSRVVTLLDAVRGSLGETTSGEGTVWDVRP